LPRRLRQITSRAGAHDALPEIADELLTPMMPKQAASSYFAAIFSRHAFISRADCQSHTTASLPLPLRYCRRYFHYCRHADYADAAFLHYCPMIAFSPPRRQMIAAIDAFDVFDFTAAAISPSFELHYFSRFS
jgi:hypothetical protein